MGTRFTKAATPRGGYMPNTASHMVGSNLRKQKLTEGAGTNPGKQGSGKALMSLSPGASGYVQDSAPGKQLSVKFAVGGPGFPKPLEK